MSSRLEVLENYFSILSKEDVPVDSAHPLADDTKRYRTYASVREGFSRLAHNLDAIDKQGEDRAAGSPQFLPELAKGLRTLETIPDADFDHYVRTLAVDQLTSKNSLTENEAPDLLGHLMGGLVAFFFDQKDGVYDIIFQAVEDIKDEQKKAFSFFNKQKKENTASMVTATLSLYEKLEQLLKEAKQGLVAKDKKMLEVLRQLKADVGKSIIEAAMDHTRHQGASETPHPSGSKAQQLKYKEKEERIAQILASKKNPDDPKRER